MNNTKDALYEEYAAIVKSLKDLETRKDELQALILDDMGAAGLQQIKTDKATFSITATTKYNYSDAVKTSETYLKDLKEQERTNGTATKEENPCLRVQLI